MDSDGSPLIKAFSDEPNFETGEEVQIPFVRDGGPRVFNKKIWISNLARYPGEEDRVRASIGVSGVAVIDHSGYRDLEISQFGRHVFYLDEENPNRLFYKRILVQVEAAVTKIENDEWRFIESPRVLSSGPIYNPLPEQMNIWRNELRVCR